MLSPHALHPSLRPRKTPLRRRPVQQHELLPGRGVVQAGGASAPAGDQCKIPLRLDQSVAARRETVNGTTRPGGVLLKPEAVRDLMHPAALDHI